MLNTEVLGLNVEGRLRSVVIRKDGVEATLQTRHAIVGLPAPLILKLLRPEPPPHLRKPPQEEIAFKKSTALVYLMADGEARFPHNWLHITDMRFRMGRVVNYGTWNGNMVPRGKTALCVEYFSVEGDGIMELSKDELLKLAVSEAQQNGLIDANRIFDHLVIQMPAVNAATVFTDWRGVWMKDALAYLRGIEGLIETNRPGTDRATLAGMDAAQACLTGKPMSDRSLQETIGWE